MGDYTGAVARPGSFLGQLKKKLGERPSVLDFTGIDFTEIARKTVLTGTISAGTPNLVAAGAGFTVDNEGDLIEVGGAGVAGETLSTTILTWISATQVTLAANASTGVAGATVYWGYNFAPVLNTAMAGIFADHGGGILKLTHDGALMASGVIDIPSNFLLSSDGWNATLHSVNHAAAPIRFNGVSNSGIRGIRRRSNATTRLTAHETCSILMQNCVNCTVENFVIEGSASVGIWIANSQKIRVHDGYVKDTLADGVHVVEGSSIVTVSDCHAENTGDDSFSAVAYDVHSQTKNVTFIACHSKASLAGGVACAGARNVLIEACQVYDSASHGLRASYDPSFDTHIPDRNILRGNLTENCGTAGEGFNSILVDRVVDAQLEGNMVIGGKKVYVFQCTTASIKNNQLDGGRQILVDGGTDITTHGNEFANLPCNPAVSVAPLVIQNVVGGRCSHNNFHNCMTIGSATFGFVDISSCIDLIGHSNYIYNPGTWTGAAFGPVRITSSTRTRVGVLRSDSLSVTGKPIPPELGGTGANTAFSQHAVPYIGTEGVYIHDVAKFFFNPAYDGSGALLWLEGRLIIPIDRSIFGSGFAAFLNLFSGQATLAADGNVQLRINNANTVPNATIDIRSNGALVAQIHTSGKMGLGQNFDTLYYMATIGKIKATTAKFTNLGNSLPVFTDSSGELVTGAPGAGQQIQVDGGGTAAQQFDLFDVTPAASNPHKYFSIDLGVLQIWNSAFTSVLLELLDAGALVIPNGVAGGNLISEHHENTAGGAPGIVTRFSRGTRAAPVKVLDGDRCFVNVGGLWDGVQYRNAAGLTMEVDGAVVNTTENPTTPSSPMACVLESCDVNSVTRTKRWKVRNAGHFEPAADNAYNSGSALNRIKKGYFVDLSVTNGITKQLNATASSSLTATTSYSDISGATVTLDRDGTWAIIAVFGISVDGGGSGAVQVAEGQLVYDGAAQTPSGFHKVVSTGGGGVSYGATASQTYVVSNTGSKVAKLQGKKSDTGSGVLFTTATRIMAIFLG